MFRMSGDQSSFDVSLRLAEETARNGLSPIVVELQTPPEGSGSAKPGLFDVLTGEAALGEIIVQDPQSSLYTVAAGARPQNHDELIASGRIALVIDALLRRFDAVFIAAGGLENGDAAAISESCDLALVAAPSDELSGRQIGEMNAKLRASGIYHAAILSESPDALTLYDAVGMRGAVPDAATAAGRY